MNYSYKNYEEAYYKGNWNKCKEVGFYLLSKKNDKRSSKLLKEIKTIDYHWDLNPKELERISKILLAVKVWLMVWKD